MVNSWIFLLCGWLRLWAVARCGLWLAVAALRGRPTPTGVKLATRHPRPETIARTLKSKTWRAEVFNLRPLAPQNVRLGCFLDLMTAGLKTRARHHL